MTDPMQQQAGGVAAVVLAAGAGSRFAGPEHKLRAPFRGRSVVQWAVEDALAGGFEVCYVVTGAVELRDLLDERVVIVQNHDWEQGQASSLRAGVFVAGHDGHDAVVVGLGDQPLVGSQAWQLVAEMPGDLVTATFEGRRSPPVKLGSVIWPLLPLSGDEGARVLMRQRPDMVREVPCHGSPVDLDTLADLETWS